MDLIGEEGFSVLVGEEGCVAKPIHQFFQVRLRDVVPAQGAIEHCQVAVGVPETVCSARCHVRLRCVTAMALDDVNWGLENAKKHHVQRST